MLCFPGQSKVLVPSGSLDALSGVPVVCAFDF